MLKAGSWRPSVSARWGAKSKTEHAGRVRLHSCAERKRSPQEPAKLASSAVSFSLSHRPHAAQAAEARDEGLLVRSITP